MNYANYLGQMKETPQNQPIPGRSDRVKNYAGGYVFKTDPFVQLRRFLCLGTEGGTYYASEREVAIENLDNIIRLLDQDHKKVLDLAAEMSFSGWIVKNDPAIVVLALGLSHKKKDVRTYAAAKFKEIVRIPTHLFTFASYIKKLRGWGRLLRETVADWYSSKSRDELVYHVLKYQQREGWKHLDLLRLAHVRPKDEFQDRLFGWLAEKKEPPKHSLIEAFLALRKAEKVQDVLSIIRDYDVTWEFVPTEWLKYSEVWQALLPKLPFIALVRNLARMSSCGALKPFSEETEFVIRRMTNPEIVKKSKIHPIQAAVALKTYARGRGIRGKLTWTVDNRLVEALDELVALSFGNIERTGKRFFLGLDVSGSMTHYTCCDVLNCMEGAAVMALATVKAEDFVFTGAFSGRFQEFPITRKDTVNSVYERMKQLDFDVTDCAQPMLYALEREIPVDVFVVYTDNETWAGRIHPCQALEKYRQKMGISAKLAIVGMAATRFSIADPEDPYQLDVIGFDATTPRAIAEFSKL